MIGRGALIRPWIFRDTVAALRGEPIPPPPDPVEVVEGFVDALRRLSPESLWFERLLNFQQMILFREIWDTEEGCKIGGHPLWERLLGGGGP